MDAATAQGAYDYIIVGAGSAGCVLANRLTEDPDVRVLLLEAGGPDRSLYIHMPSALSYPMNDPKLSWQFHTEPQTHMDGRRLHWPRGKVLGGSSSINGMCHVFGHPFDYDRWAEETGFADWSHAHCRPYFQKAERRDRGGDAYRGDSGPTAVTTGGGRNPLYQAWIEAGRQAGYPMTQDQNGFQQEGFGEMQMTVDHGRRCSTAVAYLKPARARPNLAVRTRALTTRIVFDGTRAVGVAVSHKGARAETVRATREVIVAAGPLNDPQLLMLSGLGDPAQLKAHDLPVVAALPGVGANLQDHLEVYIQHACTQPITLYSAQFPPTRLRIGLEWLLFKTGLGATSHFEAGGFIRSAPGHRHPNIQYHFLPIAINYDGSNPSDRHGFQAHMGPMRPTSRGTVTLRSADPRDPPVIDPQCLSTHQDVREFREGVKLTREVFAQPAFDTLRGEELRPGAHARTDAEIDAFVRAFAESAYHPSCTCKMGATDDPLAVVDGTGRVYGVDGLRVIDSAIMPSIPSGNLNLPTIMMAEKLADVIRGRAPLPPCDAPVYEPADWQTAQR